MSSFPPVTQGIGLGGQSLKAELGVVGGAMKTSRLELKRSSSGQDDVKCMLTKRYMQDSDFRRAP